jgi:hypothetical protein
MRHFIFFVAIIAFVVFSYGFVAPTLISYPDTMIVLGGIVYAAVVAPVVVWSFVGFYVKNAIKKLKGEK